MDVHRHAFSMQGNAEGFVPSQYDLCAFPFEGTVLVPFEPVILVLEPEVRESN